MTEVDAARKVAVAGSVCGDPKRVEELDEQHADQNKRPRFDDGAKKQADADVTKPEREDVMGKEILNFQMNPEIGEGMHVCPEVEGCNTCLILLALFRGLVTSGKSISSLLASLKNGCHALER